MVTTEAIRALAAYQEQLSAAVRVAVEQNQRAINAAGAAVEQNQRSIRAAAVAAGEQIRSINAAFAAAGEWQRAPFKRIATVVESCKAATNHALKVRLPDPRPLRPRWFSDPHHTSQRSSLSHPSESGAVPPASAPYRRSPSIGFR